MRKVPDRGLHTDPGADLARVHHPPEEPGCQRIPPSGPAHLPAQGGRRHPLPPGLDPLNYALHQLL